MPRKNEKVRARKFPSQIKAKPNVRISVKQFDRPWRYRNDIHPGLIAAIAHPVAGK